MGAFEQAGQRLIDSLTEGLYDAAKNVMRVSLTEVPVSDATTYVEQYGTAWRTVNGKRVNFPEDEDNPIIGDEGTLFRSSRVFPPVRMGDEVTVTLGYGFGEEVNPAGKTAAEYAVVVHEKAEYRHTPPEKDHYLSDPVNAFAGEFVPYLAAKVKEGTLGTELVILEGDAINEAA